MNKQEHKYQDYIVFDFETGGLNARINPVTEIAIVILDGRSLEIKKTYSSYFLPYPERTFYDPKAMAFTGITMEKLEALGKPIKTIVQEIIDLITPYAAFGQKYKPLLVGHNVDFDIAYLHQIFEITKNSLAPFLSGEKEGDYFGNFQPHRFDTQRLSMAKWAQDSKVTSHTLSICIEKAGLELSDAHSALPDTIATAELFCVHINHLRAELISTKNHSTETKSYRENYFQC